MYDFEGCWYYMCLRDNICALGMGAKFRFCFGNEEDFIFNEFLNF